ncbi:methyltransferase family protein [Massilia sp. LXY-6]|uniref:methyltransferase family protein n=1 Tax=Massilia sp. LXY-6 TaxID=3379823 RepID=UPI003EDE8129
MNTHIGNFLFKYRNALGPCLFLAALCAGRPAHPFGSAGWNLAFDLAGVLCAMLGQALRIVTIGYEYIERGGRNRQVYASKLVQGGVFAHCRNPLYVGNVLMAAGFALIFHSWVFYLVVLPLVLYAYSCIVAAEEAFLGNKFGPEYRRYCERVNRWWPRLSGWQRSLGDMRFNWRRVLVKEYNTIFVLILSLTVLKLWSEYLIAGDAQRPSTDVLAAGLVIWLSSYFLVRSLKKSGMVQA